MKNKKDLFKNYAVDFLISAFSKKSMFKKGLFCVCVLIAVAGLVLNRSNSTDDLATITDTPETFTIATSPVAATASKKDVITIPTGIVKTNPFVPYRNIDNESYGLVNDIPQFDLVAPPDFTEGNSEAAKIMDTIVSGILFDKFSPSAILNIEGNDYLVKKGDTVHSYKIVNITQDSVTVQLGKNTYKAGIGELLTEGSVNYNDVSNLNKKFGGEKR